jgi:hypothetical protein
MDIRITRWSTASEREQLIGMSDDEQNQLFDKATEIGDEGFAIDSFAGTSQDDSIALLGTSDALATSDFFLI